MGKKEGFTDYILRGIPSEFWKQVRAKAIMDGRDVKDVLLEGLKNYLTEKPKKKS